mmetsp:Transcript_58449/g.162979  ORF Transcript_58449/g.162979 Transcript_58449/m.162979 type:complete len:329 (+) Transcript_58449:49-1035(+)
MYWQARPRTRLAPSYAGALAARAVVVPATLVFALWLAFAFAFAFALRPSSESPFSFAFVFAAFVRALEFVLDAVDVAVVAAIVAKFFTFFFDPLGKILVDRFQKVLAHIDRLVEITLLDVSLGADEQVERFVVVPVAVARAPATQQNRRPGLLLDVAHVSIVLSEDFGLPRKRELGALCVHVNDVLDRKILRNLASLFPASFFPLAALSFVSSLALAGPVVLGTAVAIHCIASEDADGLELLGQPERHAEFLHFLERQGAQALFVFVPVRLEQIDVRLHILWTTTDSMRHLSKELLHGPRHRRPLGGPEPLGHARTPSSRGTLIAEAP